MIAPPSGPEPGPEPGRAPAPDPFTVAPTVGPREEQAIRARWAVVPQGLWLIAPATGGEPTAVMSEDPVTHSRRFVCDAFPDAVRNLPWAPSDYWPTLTALCHAHRDVRYLLHTVDVLRGNLDQARREVVQAKDALADVQQVQVIERYEHDVLVAEHQRVSGETRVVRDDPSQEAAA